MSSQKITDRGVAGLPISEGRAELLEEIMNTNPVTHRTYRALLVPIAASAAVVAGVGGAWSLSTADDRDHPARGSGLASSPAGAGSSREAPTGRTSCFVTYDQGSTPPATDAPVFADCDEVVLDEQGPADPVEEERYQHPPRPVLIGADGWEVEGVHGAALDWVGPDGAELHLSWVQTDDADPFAYERYPRAGERIEVLGLVGRLTGFVEGGDRYQVLITSPVEPGGPALVLETSSLGAAELRDLVGSLTWVSRAEYAAVVRPAVG